MTAASKTPTNFHEFVELECKLAKERTDFLINTRDTIVWNLMSQLNAARNSDTKSVVFKLEIPKNHGADTELMESVFREIRNLNHPYLPGVALQSKYKIVQTDAKTVLPMSWKPWTREDIYQLGARMPSLHIELRVVGAEPVMLKLDPAQNWGSFRKWLLDRHFGSYPGSFAEYGRGTIRGRGEISDETLLINIFAHGRSKRRIRQFLQDTSCIMEFKIRFRL